MRIDTAWLMGNHFGSALWGIYSMVFFVTIWATHKRGTDSLHSPVICGIVFLFILNLGLTGFYAAKTHEAFATAGQSATSFLRSSQGYTIVVVTDFAMFFSIITTDITLAWRVYVIYSRNVKVLAAVLVIISGSIVSGICALWWAGKQMADNHFFSHCDGAEAKPVTCPYQRLIVVLIESGAFYSAVWVVWILAYVMDESWNLGVFVIPITPRMVALIPTLVVLQRSLGYIQTSELPIAPTSQVEFAVFTTRPSSPTLVASVPNFKDDIRVGSIHVNCTGPENIIRFRETLLLRPKDDPERPNDLHALARSLARRYGEEDDIADLYEAVGLLQEALLWVLVNDQRRIHIQRSLDSVKRQLERALDVRIK